MLVSNHKIWLLFFCLLAMKYKTADVINGNTSIGSIVKPTALLFAANQVRKTSGALICQKGTRTKRTTKQPPVKIDSKLRVKTDSEELFLMFLL